MKYSQNRDRFLYEGLVYAMKNINLNKSQLNGVVIDPRLSIKDLEAEINELDPELHKKLAIQAKKKRQSLNTFIQERLAG